MKKILLSMLIAGCMMPVIAQQKALSKNDQNQRSNARVEHASINGEAMNGVVESMPAAPYNPAKKFAYSDVELQELPQTPTRYDMQSQGNAYNQIHVFKDGFIGMAWSFAENAANTSTDRKIAYSFSKDNGVTWEDADMFVGGVGAYWATYTAWGANGELIVARTNMNNSNNFYDGLIIFRRPQKGVGEWETIKVSYPEDAQYTDEDGYNMVWARICVTGANNEYIHILTGLALPGYFEDPPNITDPYHGVSKYPIIYNRTQTGGDTWDFEWRAIQEVTEGWDPEKAYSETYTWAIPKDGTIAFTMNNTLDDGIVLRSNNHGETWEKTKYFESYLDVSGVAPAWDTTMYPRPMRNSSVAIGNDKKLHIAFPFNSTGNSTTEDTYIYNGGPSGGAIGYWNEDRGTYDTASFEVIYKNWFEEFFAQSDEPGSYYPSCITEKYNKYIIGQAISVYTDPPAEICPDYKGFLWPDETYVQWSYKSYRSGGVWNYPQMVIDKTGTIHVAYLGILDGGIDGNDNPYRHVYYTCSYDNGETWEKPIYVTDDIAMALTEFSYLGVGGIYGRDIYYFIQTDDLAGTYINGVPKDEGDTNPHDHSQTDNKMYCIILRNAEGVKEHGEKMTIEVKLIPNPAKGSSQVTLNEVSTVMVYNLLGQPVHKAENVIGAYDIPLTGLASGAYLVTVRNAHGIATKKLIVQ